MKKRLLALLLVFVMLMGLVPMAGAEGMSEQALLEQFEIRLRVFERLDDMHGYPVENAVIALRRPNGEILYLTKTNGNEVIHTDTLHGSYYARFVSSPDGVFEPNWTHYGQTWIYLHTFDGRAPNWNDFPLWVGRPRFTDLDPNAYYRDAIMAVYSWGLMNGTSDTTFEPHISLDRAMLATLLHRYAGLLTDLPAVTFRPVFSDVTAGRWYSDGIIWASDNGLVNGVGDGRFAPTQQLARQELAVMLHRFAVSQGQDAGVPSHIQAPAGTAPWATEAMRWAVHNELFLGDGVPTTYATRADTAVFIYRFDLYMFP